MRKMHLALAFFALSVGLMTFSESAVSQEKPAAKPVEPEKAARPGLPTGKMDAAEWLKASTAPLAAGEIDRLVSEQLAKIGIKPAPRTNDLEFLRRVYLDTTGRLPAPADISEFVKDSAADKRARLIDKLLASDAFADHWASYWREVVTSRTTDFRANILSRHFEKWMKEQIKENKSWASVTKDILTATGDIMYDTADKNGQGFFLASRTGTDAENERAAETSRVFLGIQIQCAQCHDHPSDVWKREQFHQLAAYFAKLRDRPIREEKKQVGVSLTAVNFGEHMMPGKDGKAEPKKAFGFGKKGGQSGTAMKPRFIDGKSPESVSTDTARRTALADSIVSKDNPWFAGAFVNRIWGAMMGQSFYQPIDDLGPEKEATMPEVLARIAGSFRGNDYNVRQLYRDILTSETYQRQIRPGSGADDHLMFAANNPVRMSSAALWNSLVAIGVGGGGSGGFGGKGGFGGGFGKGRLGGFGLEGSIKQEFAFDPSTKAEEIEGSVLQALILMNSPQIEQRIKADGGVLSRILKAHSDDDEALRSLYLRVLARRPTDREVARCKEQIRTAANRGEGYEDILWALINSTEFQTKR